MIPTFDFTIINAIITLCFAYSLGSIPFGIIISHLMGLGNLRKIGSGNIGATNVLRTGNKKAAALTLLCDAGKGGVAIIIARVFYGDDLTQLAAVGVFIGHCYPIWLQFKGGKGVATFLGILCVLFWPVGLIACLTWLITALTTRISSVSALLSSITAPIWFYVLDKPDTCLLAMALAILLWLRHKDNIKRLYNGTENKIA